MEKIIIRNETERDYKAVEELHRNAFWNLSSPGCNEHYLAHILRTHKDFIPELDLVCEQEGNVIANVMYSKSWLMDEKEKKTEIITFGPISVDPAYQRMGIGKEMLSVSFDKALELGYGAVVIYGNPDNYVSRGFKSCKKYNVCIKGGVFPAAMLVKELKTGFFDGNRYYYQESSAFEIDEHEAERFDLSFPVREKKIQPSQEEFYIHSHSVIQ